LTLRAEEKDDYGMQQAQARSFDSIASIYDRTRPGYPQEVYALARSLGVLSPESHVLEIGAGQGIATQEITEYFQCFVQAIEPGRQFCDLMKEKFSANRKVSISNCSFEEFSSETLYDAIFAATSFHWVSPTVKFSKTSQLLENDGILVLYWNSYSLADHDLNRLVQEVYKEHFPDRDYSKSIYEIQEDKIRNRQNEVSASDLFHSVQSKRFLSTSSLSIEKYIDLLRTFSENAILDKSVSGRFYKDMESCLTKNASLIDVAVLTNVEIARKI
jgi:SAM-dependent methyltransferase